MSYHLFDVIEDKQFLIDLFSNLAMGSRVSIEHFMLNVVVEKQDVFSVRKDDGGVMVFSDSSILVLYLMEQKLNKFHLRYLPNDD